MMWILSTDNESVSMDLIVLQDLAVQKSGPKLYRERITGRKDYRESARNRKQQEKEFADEAEPTPFLQLGTLLISGSQSVNKVKQSQKA